MSCSNNDTFKAATVILLTLEEHKDGIWITRLVRALEEQQQQQQSPLSLVDFNVSVVTLESLFHSLDPSSSTPLQPFFVSSSSSSSTTPPRRRRRVVVVNRVSDAASPPLQKACLGLLQLLQSVYKIPVWNGPTGYALCSNKWCQHALFCKAKLDTPSTRVLLHPSPRRLQQAISQVVLQTDGTDGTTTCQNDSSVLLKPNSGGFGEGIQRISNDVATTNNEHKLEEVVSDNKYADGMTLVQAHGDTNVIYRVWFLLGKVQCGLVRTTNQNRDDFTSGCMGSSKTTACSRQQPQHQESLSDTTQLQPQHAVKVYDIPSDVVMELEEKLLPLLPDVHSGSVEFFYSDAGTRRRLYFDLNLLSTLPLVEHVVQAEDCKWKENYDPWKEMATAIVNMTYC